MVALRYIYVLALVVWLGGMITIGSVVAPAVFRTLEQTSADSGTGRAQAASVVGEVLRRFHVVTYGAGIVLGASLVTMKLIGPRPVGFGARLTIVGLMLTASLVSGLVVDRRIADLRTAIGQPVSSLPAEDPRRMAFGRLHALSTALMGVAVAGGLLLCYWETRE
jgi:uncharacterized membrane protein